MHNFMHPPFLDSEDYTPTSGSLIFTPSDVSKSVVVFIRDDSVVEYPERLFLTLSVPDTEGGVALLEPRRVAITITNDDGEAQENCLTWNLLISKNFHNEILVLWEPLSIPIN